MRLINPRFFSTCSPLQKYPESIPIAEVSAEFPLDDGSLTICLRQVHDAYTESNVDN